MDKSKSISQGWTDSWQQKEITREHRRSSATNGNLACMTGARKGRGIGKSGVLERKGSALQGGKVVPAASPLFGSHFTVIFRS